LASSAGCTWKSMGGGGGQPLFEICDRLPGFIVFFISASMDIHCLRFSFSIVTNHRNIPITCIQNMVRSRQGNAMQCISLFRKTNPDRL
jgi:hypothetical protein